LKWLVTLAFSVTRKNNNNKGESHGVARIWHILTISTGLSTGDGHFTVLRSAKDGGYGKEPIRDKQDPGVVGKGGLRTGEFAERRLTSIKAECEDLRERHVMWV
jgi:hypothetical protein